MSSITQQIQELLAPPVASTSQARTLEYLNTTYPSLDALIEGDNFDEAVKEAKASSDELRAQLEASTTGLSTKISGTRSSTSISIKSAKELSLTRHALVDQLATLEEDLVPSSKGKQKSLLEELEELHLRLAELQNSRQYVAVIDRSLALSEAAIAEVRLSSKGSISQSSLSQYMELQSFVSSVLEATASSTSSEPLRLDTFLREIRERTWKDIVGVLSETLLEAADALRWPTPIDPSSYRTIDPALRKSFESHFINLLNLQAAGEAINLAGDALNATPEKQKAAVRRGGLFPLQALLEPISMRFRYHFDGKRQTNKLDKPEWYFTHTLNLMHEHRPFVTEILQDLLVKGGYGDINAYDEFCRILFALPSRKLKKTVPLLLNAPAVLAHTVYQTLIFDGSMRDRGFEIRRTWEGRERTRLVKAASKLEAKSRTKGGRDGEGEQPTLGLEWDGLSEIILGNKEWFEAWLEGEKRFADNQYNDIISSPDAWQISDDAGDDPTEDDPVAGDLASRATTSARRFKALIERVTERYIPLPHLIHKSHFLFDIQMPLLEAYLSRITSSLDAYERLSSSFVRAVPGALAGQVGHGTDTKRLTSGVEGLNRVVKALLSARWIKRAMEGWGEDLFFLELWQGIQDNPVLRARADDHLMLPPSRPVKSLDDQAANTLFDVLIKHYGALVERAEEMISKQISAEVESDLKLYFANQYEKSTEDSTQEEQQALSIPATLVAPISLLSSELTFIARSVPSTTALSLYRKIASAISNHIVQRSVSHRGRNPFSPTEGKTFKDECAMWVEASRLALANGGDASLVRRVELPWQGLLDVAAVVGMPEEMFTQAMHIVYNGSDAGVDSLMTELGVRGLKREDIQALLKARTDFQL